MADLARFIQSSYSLHYVDLVLVLPGLNGVDETL